MSAGLTIHTIGHSTRTAEAFLGLLKAHRIRRVADVRSIPASRRHPHFARQSLEHFLASAGITYRHFPELGGRREPRADSPNSALRHRGFRGYADHMQTPEFHAGILSLETFASSDATSVMCAEAVWWQCHRRLLSDALVVRGVKVVHILTLAQPKPHQLSEFGREHGGTVIYPGLL